MYRNMRVILIAITQINLVKDDIFMAKIVDAIFSSLLLVTFACFPLYCIISLVVRCSLLIISDVCILHS